MLSCSEGIEGSQSSSLRSPQNLKNRTILGQEDYSFLGYYDVPRNLGGGTFEWGQAFTHRYVNGQLRFLSITLVNPPTPLIEFSPPANFGSQCTFVNSWSNIWSGSSFTLQGRWVGLWWDEAQQRLWTTTAIDYPDDNGTYETYTIHTRALNSGGTISNLKGRVGLQGIGARRIYGGAQAIPPWFQSRYGTGPYVVGWGGYTSRVAQGLSASLGPTAYAIPDLSSFSDESSIPSSQFKVLMDCGNGAFGGDWLVCSGSSNII